MRRWPILGPGGAEDFALQNWRNVRLVASEVPRISRAIRRAIGTRASTSMIGPVTRLSFIVESRHGLSESARSAAEKLSSRFVVSAARWMAICASILPRVRDGVLSREAKFTGVKPVNGRRS